MATKLQPPLHRTDTIQRVHLETTLASSVSSLPLTLLSAPAGYGKTTLLAALGRLLPATPLAWVTLDAEDNDPMRFMGLLVCALQRLHPACGQSVWPLLASGTTEGSHLKRAANALISDIMQCMPDPFILVLDDLHFVSDAAIFITLQYLLDHLPPQLHLVIGTRHDPPLRLARLAARRQLAEFRQPSLGFQQNEVQQLLNDTLALHLSEDEIAALHTWTEGWPAGLCLLAGPLSRMDSVADRAKFMATISNTERYALDDFFAEEILGYLPADLRRFLIQTSILNEMTPSICRAVTERADAGEVLAELYRHNLTIASLTSEETGEPVYRHHGLFARFLTRQLEREMPDELKELHRRAGRAQKTAGRAIAHYLAAGLWDEAAELMLESGMQLLHQGMAETVRRWYNTLPESMRFCYPRLTVIVGRCEIHRGDYDAANWLLHQARTACVEANDIAGEGEALTSLITIAYQNDDRQAAVALVERALQLPLNPMGQVAARLARAWVNLEHSKFGSICRDVCDALSVPHVTGDRRADLIGITYMSAPLVAAPGCIVVTERYCAEAGALAPPDTAWRLGADELGNWPKLWKGQIENALSCAVNNEALRQRLGGYPFVGNDLPVQLTVLYMAKGDLAAVEQATESLLQRMKKAPRGKYYFYLHAAGRALAWLQRTAEARLICQELAALPNPIPLVHYMQTHLVGLIALLEGELDHAASSLAQAAKLETQLANAWVGGSARLLQARLLLENGEKDLALATTRTVLEEWAKLTIPGCILLDGPVVLPVVRLAASEGIALATQALTLYSPEIAQVASIDLPSSRATEVNMDSARTQTNSRCPMAQLAEPLTAREGEVLKLIVAGCTNRQIAAELFITQETVKSHVVHILRKLDVTSRTQAAIRAKELGF